MQDSDSDCIAHLQSSKGHPRIHCSSVSRQNLLFSPPLDDRNKSIRCGLGTNIGPMKEKQDVIACKCMVAQPGSGTQSAYTCTRARGNTLPIKHTFHAYAHTHANAQVNKWMRKLTLDTPWVDHLQYRTEKSQSLTLEKQTTEHPEEDSKSGSYPREDSGTFERGLSFAARQQ